MCELQLETRAWSMGGVGWAAGREGPLLRQLPCGGLRAELPRAAPGTDASTPWIESGEVVVVLAPLAPISQIGGSTKRHVSSEASGSTAGAADLQEEGAKQRVVGSWIMPYQERAVHPQPQVTSARHMPAQGCAAYVLQDARAKGKHVDGAVYPGATR